MRHYTQKSKINQDVARKVMGWKLKDGTWRGEADCYILPASDRFAYENSFGFNPMERIEHAMMVLDKFDDWMLNHHISGDVCCTICPSEAYSKTKEHAICLAALRAKGVKGY